MAPKFSNRKDDNMYNIEKINEYLKNNLSKYRYEHSIIVAEEAKLLAHHYNYSEAKAYIAGLVHDIAKEFTEEENKKWIKKYNLSSELLIPELNKIVHADIGAVVVKELYNLDDDICNAVKYHTIGNVSMNTLAKIIFIADKIGRKKITPEMEEEKNLAYKNLDLAIALHLKNTERKLKNIGKELHPESQKLLNRINKNNKN